MASLLFYVGSMLFGFTILGYVIIAIAGMRLLLDMTSRPEWPQVDIAEGWKVLFCLVPLLTVAAFEPLMERTHPDDEQFTAICFASAVLNLITAAIAAILINRSQWYIVLLVASIMGLGLFSFLVVLCLSLGSLAPPMN